MKKVFVTGGAGFVGSHLVDRLLYDGLEVTVFDNCSTGRADNLKRHFENPRLHVFYADILDTVALEHAMQGHDTVWHLAAKSLVASDGRHDAELQNNLLGTVNVLEAMRKLKVGAILFTSSGAVYGDEPGELLKETHGPLRPISLYAAAKAAAEMFVSAYSHLFGIEAWIFRFASNVVGGRMNRGVVHDFIRKLQKNPRELEIWGDGLGQKAYFLVEECVAGMLHAYCERYEHDHDFHCDVYNLGADTTTAVDRVAQIVIEELGLTDVKLVHQGGRYGFPGDVPSVNFDTLKMARLGWRVRHTSEQALRIAAGRIIRNEP